MKSHVNFTGEEEIDILEDFVEPIEAAIKALSPEKQKRIFTLLEHGNINVIDIVCTTLISRKNKILAGVP